jgi:hypothetical protein
MRELESISKCFYSFKSAIRFYRLFKIHRQVLVDYERKMCFRFHSVEGMKERAGGRNMQVQPIEKIGSSSFHFYEN